MALAVLKNTSIKDIDWINPDLDIEVTLEDKEKIILAIGSYLAKSAIRFHGIYWLFLIIIVAVLAALPYMKKSHLR